MGAGGSAQRRADELRDRAAQARADADALEARAGAWAAGADGERRVAEILGRLPNGWHVHHDRLLRPGHGQTNLDHVVIGPSGVYLLDTKNWAGGTSVHQGNLWQHTSSSSPKGRELDSLARFAGEMERTLGLPVVPVIALAGAGSSSFAHQRVRGVEIVAHTKVVGWLRSQPGVAGADTTAMLSRRVANMYPSATAEPDAGASSVMVADVVGAPRRNPEQARQPSTARPRTGRRRRPLASAVLALVAFLALEGLASVVLPRVSSWTASRVPAPASVAQTGSTPPRKACEALGPDSIKRISGSKLVLAKASVAEDVCGWWLTKPRYTTQPADVSVETGRSVRLRFATTGTTAARVDRLPGEVSAWLPAGARLEGWKSALRAQQPFFVSFRFSYPPSANQTQARALEAAAEKRVVQLSQALAAQLPADPGG